MNSHPYKPQTSWSDILLVFLAVLIALWMSGALTGCTSEKSVMKGVSKGLAYYPIQTIQKVRLFAPCVTTGHSFSTDSAAYKNSVDSLAQTKAFYEALISGASTPIEHDTAFDLICVDYLREIDRLKKKNEYQDKYIIKLTDDFNHVEPIIVNHYDTTEDVGKVMEKDVELQEFKRTSIKQLERLSNDLDKANNKVGSKNKQLLWLYILLGLHLLFYIGRGIIRWKTKPVSTLKKFL